METKKFLEENPFSLFIALITILNCPIIYLYAYLPISFLLIIDSLPSKMYILHLQIQ